MVPPFRWSYEIKIETTEQADDFIKDFNKQESKKIFDALTKKMWIKIIKEKIEKFPKLADHNFKIEDTTQRKPIVDKNWVKAIVNFKGDILEYLEGKYAWEQFFTTEAALRETKRAGKILPGSWKIYEDIVETTYDWDYQRFLKEQNVKFFWYRKHHAKKFQKIDEEFAFICADGSCYFGNKEKWTMGCWYKTHAYSVRCLK